MRCVAGHQHSVDALWQPSAWTGWASSGSCQDSEEYVALLSILVHLEAPWRAPVLWV